MSRTDPLPPPPTGDEPSRPLKIVIADYPTIVRAGIASLLSAQPGMEILAAGATADQCLEALRGLRRQIDVLLLVGLGIPGERGSLWLIRSVRDQFPTVPILACGANADDMTVSQALFTGADGFVSKDVEPEAFVDAVRRAAEGHLVLEGVPDSWVVQIAENVERAASTEPVLTQREAEVLAVAAEGLTARQIGHRLGVRERTVTTHLGRIYRKLGASGRIAALTAASEFGVLALARRQH